MLTKKLALIAGIIVVILLLTACTNYKHLVLSGTVESSQVEAGAEVAGKVIKLNAEEGQTVKSGDIIAELDPEQFKLAVRQQEAIVNLKTAKLEELRSGTRSQQLAQAKANIDSANASVKNAESLLENLRISYDYLSDKLAEVKSLYKSGTASDSDLKDAQYRVDTAAKQVKSGQSQLDTAKAQLKSAQSQYDLLNAGATAQSIKAAEADLEQSKVSLEQARLSLSKCLVKAPVEGIIHSYNVESGDMVNIGSSISTITEPLDMWVNIYVPQKKLSLVSLNQKIDLTCTALDDIKVKGAITYISEKAEFTPKNTQTDEAKDNTVFRVKIRLDNPDQKLKPGMTVEASFAE